MATKLYDLAVKTGSYTDGQGQDKGRYLNVGAVMEGDNGKFLMLNKTFNPAGVPDLSGRGGDSVLISMFEPRNNNGQQQSNQQPQGQQQSRGSNSNDSFDDEKIPF